MRGAGSAERTGSKAVVLAFFGLLALPLRAAPDQDALPPAHGIPRATELAIVRYKLLALEQRRFDQQFALTGRPAGEAIQALRQGGYTCVVDPPSSSRGTSGAASVAPGVVCERRSTAEDDVCRVRTARLSVDWQDSGPSADGLEAQLGLRRVAERTFRCD